MLFRIVGSTLNLSLVLVLLRTSHVTIQELFSLHLFKILGPVSVRRKIESLLNPEHDDDCIVEISDDFFVDQFFEKIDE